MTFVIIFRGLGYKSRKKDISAYLSLSNDIMKNIKNANEINNLRQNNKIIQLY